MTFMSAKYFRIVISLLMGIVLTIVPLPHALIWLRPQWVLAILIFWTMTSPGEVGIVFAWWVGILMDLISGTVLGEQALIFVTIIYIVLKYHWVILHFPPWQQAVMVGLLACLNGIMQGLISGWTGHSAYIFLHELSVITTILIWPFIYAILDRYRPRPFIQ